MKHALCWLAVSLFFIPSCHRVQTVEPLKPVQYQEKMLEGTWVWWREDVVAQPSDRWRVDINKDGRTRFAGGENGQWIERDDGTYHLVQAEGKCQLIYSSGRKYDVVYMDSTRLMVRYPGNNVVYEAQRVGVDASQDIIGAWVSEDVDEQPGRQIEMIYAWERIHYVDLSANVRNPILEGISYKLYGDLLVRMSTGRDGLPRYDCHYLDFSDKDHLLMRYVSNDMVEHDSYWTRPAQIEYTEKELEGTWVVRFENGRKLYPYQMSVDAYYTQQASEKQGYFKNIFYSSSNFTPDSLRVWKKITSEVRLKKDVLLYAAYDNVNDTRWRSTYQILYLGPNNMITQRRYSSVNQVDRIRVATKVDQSQYWNVVEGRWEGTFDWNDGGRNLVFLEFIPDGSFSINGNTEEGIGTYRCTMTAVGNSQEVQEISGRFYLFGPLLVMVHQDGKSHWAATITSCNGKTMELTGLTKQANDKVVSEGELELKKIK